MIFNRNFNFLAALLALVILLAPTAGRAQNRVLDSIDVTPYSGRVELQINFTFAMQYLTSELSPDGETLQVQLRAVTTTPIDLQDVSTQETLGWNPSRKVPLQDVRYDGTNAGTQELTLHFQRSVKVEQVRSSSNYNSLIVVLAAPPAAPQQPPAPAPAPAPAPPTAAVAPAIPRGRFVVNLESTVQPLDLNAVPRLPVFAKYHLYVTTTQVNHRRWYRLRLGFFATKADALKLLKQLHAHYPEAWVTKVSDAEVRQAVSAAPAAKRPPAEAVPAVPYRPMSREQLRDLMRQARESVQRKNYARAIRLYTKVLRYPDEPYHQQALEYLGLARERNGQIAQAVAVYQRYLQTYPRGESAKRVRQRLDGLIAVHAAPRQKLRAGRRPEAAPQWQVYGSFSQFYQRAVNVTDAQGSTTSQSALSTGIDVSARRRSRNYDVRARFSGGYTYDFLHQPSFFGSGTGTRVAAMYLDVLNRNSTFDMRLGRQVRNSGGVFGRFDGALFSYQVLPRSKLNVVMGYPVDLSTDTVKTDRRFYGVSMDFGTFANAWDFTLYALNQRIDSLTDRRAVGGELRYFRPNQSLLSIVDYDTSYKKLNLFTLIGNHTFPSKLSVNTVIDYRRSPLLETRNAIIGQTTLTTIPDLRQTYTEEQIRQLALDRTAASRTVTVGLSRPINKRLQIAGDVTASNLSATPASGGVSAIPGTGTTYYYLAQLIGTNLIKQGDIGIIGLRYSDTSTSNTTSLLFNTRYPISSSWRINPRLRLDYRTNRSDGSHQYTVAPSIRTDYRWHRRYHFEFEAGGEWSNLNLTTTTTKTSDYYVNIGYRIDF